jgi:hypothetical protein
MRLKTLVALIALTACAAAQAALQDRRWFPVSGDDSIAVLVDLANVKRTDSIVSIWQLVLAGQDMVKFFAIVKADKRAQPRGDLTQEKGLEVARAITEDLGKSGTKQQPRHIEYDCATDKYRYIEAGVWTEITPGTFYADIEKALCSPPSSTAPDAKPSEH